MRETCWNTWANLLRRFRSSRVTITAAERGGNNITGIQAFHLKNGSSQGQNLALHVL